MPTWKEAQKSTDVPIENGLIVSETNTEVFDGFTFKELYVSEKAQEWNSNSSSKYMQSTVGHKCFSAFETQT